MKFNINKYLGNYAMHCKTEEEAKIFLYVEWDGVCFTNRQTV